VGSTGTIIRDDDYERNKIRIDPRVRSAIECVLEIVLFIILSGVGAYFLGPWWMSIGAN